MSTLLLLTNLLLSILCFTSTSNGENPPNVLILVADDLGYSDLSCFGNDMIKTPNIDKLAEDGIKFTRMYSMPSDAGSMAALLTGRQPLRMGLIKGKFGWPSFWSVAQTGGIPQREMNIGKFFSMRTHSAFFFGRWDLGSWSASLPSHQGFGGFYGTVMGHSPGCSSDMEDLLTDWDYFTLVLRHHGPMIIAVCTLLVTSKMLKFISSKLLVLLILVIIAIIFIFRVYCWLLPLNNSTCQVLENQGVREHTYNDTNLTKMTTDKIIHYLKFRSSSPFLLIASFHQPGHPAFASQDFRGKSGVNKYYDSILELDSSVGKITKTLKQLNMYNDTIIFFLSDNGPVLTHPYTGSKLKHSSLMETLQGEKLSLKEGGLRVPAIISWPNHLPSNVETRIVSSIMDIFPTVIDLMGGPNQMQKVHMKNLDGKSLLPFLKNVGRSKPSDVLHKVLLHYCEAGDMSAATVGDFKIYFVSHNKTNNCSGKILDDPVIYNIVKDPGEIIRLEANQHQDVIARARSAALRFEMSLDIQIKDLVSQFDQIPLPWHMWVSS